MPQTGAAAPAGADKGGGGAGHAVAEGAGAAQKVASHPVLTETPGTGCNNDVKGLARNSSLLPSLSGNDPLNNG